MFQTINKSNLAAKYSEKNKLGFSGVRIHPETRFDKYKDELAEISDAYDKLGLDVLVRNAKWTDPNGECIDKGATVLVKTPEDDPNKVLDFCNVGQMYYRDYEHYDSDCRVHLNKIKEKLVEFLLPPDTREKLFPYYSSNKEPLRTSEAKDMQKTLEKTFKELAKKQVPVNIQQLLSERVMQGLSSLGFEDAIKKLQGKTETPMLTTGKTISESPTAIVVSKVNSLKLPQGVSLYQETRSECKASSNKAGKSKELFVAEFTDTNGELNRIEFVKDVYSPDRNSVKTDIKQTGHFVLYKEGANAFRQVPIEEPYESKKGIGIRIDVENDGFGRRIETLWKRGFFENFREFKRKTTRTVFNEGEPFYSEVVKLLQAPIRTR